MYIHKLHYITWHDMTWQYITLHYTTLHFTSLHYTALHYTTLHCIHTYVYIYMCVFLFMYTYICFFYMCVDHVHCWSPGRMAIWGGFLVQGWGPLCDADPPRGWDGQTSREWAPDTQRDHCWGFVAACAAIPCRIFRWLVSLLILTPTPGILKLEKQLFSAKLQLASFCPRDQLTAVRIFATTLSVLSG